MTLKKFLISIGTVSLKALRALWKGFLVMMAGFGYGLVECLKHASATNEESDEDKPYGHEHAEYIRRSTANHYEGG